MDDKRNTQKLLKTGERQKLKVTKAGVEADCGTEPSFQDDHTEIKRTTMRIHVRR